MKESITDKEHLQTIHDSVLQQIDSITAELEAANPPSVSRMVGENITAHKERTRAFHQHYNHTYRTLKSRMPMSADTGWPATGVADGYSDRLKPLMQRLAKAKLQVVQPAYRLLGDELRRSNLLADDLAELMYRKQTTAGEYHQIVSGLARWQLLDELEHQLQPLNFAPCFASCGKPSADAGRPMEELYEQTDKDRLRLTLETLHYEKYHTTVVQGWAVSKKQTRQFLLAFMLSLYRQPLQALYGKIAAFQRFYRDVCMYDFVTVRSLENWFSHYHAFVREQRRRQLALPANEPQKSYDAWARQERKYASLETLVDWIRTRLPQHDVRTVG